MDPLDSAAIAIQNPEPLISYIAFYSDVEHEVTPVTSGHRVTLTWNLYFLPGLTILPSLWFMPTPQAELALKTAFTRVLSDSDFLEKGGHLGFGLRQEYPLNPEGGLVNLIECLKGSDAIIRHVCCQLSLQTSLRVIYKDEGYEEFVVVNDFVDFKYFGEVYTLSEASREEVDTYSCQGPSLMAWINSDPVTALRTKSLGDGSDRIRAY